MASKRESVTVKEAYKRERNRIQRQVNRMKKRGYEFEKSPVPAIPKTITAGSVRRLQAITTKKLYEMAKFVDIETGEILPAKKGRALERRRSAVKARATRIRKKRESEVSAVVEEEIAELIADLIKGQREEQDKEAQIRKKRRKKQDEENVERMRSDSQYSDQFESGVIAEQRVNDLLDSLERDFPKTIEALREAIISGIQNEGKKKFWQRVANNPNIFNDIEDIFYKPGDHIRPTAFNKVMNLFMNRPMTAKESQNAQDRYDYDTSSSSDFDPDERF